MSKRVTTQTEIKDLDIARAALKASNMTFEETPGNIRITSGPCRNANINLTTGEVSGDSDYGHDNSKLGLLRQSYGEAKVRVESFKNGATIFHREVTSEGDVVLHCSMG